MYLVIWIYPVPAERIEQFLRIQEQSSAIYRKYGALESVTCASEDLSPKYGCASLRDCVQHNPDKKLYVVQDRFEDKLHHDEVLEKIDADERMGDLYEELSRFVEMRRAVRGEFQSVEPVRPA